MINLQSAISKLDISVLYTINHNRINGLDNYFVFVTDTAYIIAVLIPVIFLFVGLVKHKIEMKRVAYQLFASLLISTIVTSIIKYSVQRVRPFITYPYIEKLSTGGSPSFPSGHTADAFLIAMAVTLIFKGSPKIISPLWIWATLVAYSRMALGVHYPTDVIGSMIIGSSCAIFGNWLFSTNLLQPPKIKFQIKNK